MFLVFRSVDDQQSTIVLLLNYRSELLVAQSVYTLVGNFSQQTVKIALKQNSPKCETKNQIFLKRKITGSTISVNVYIVQFFLLQEVGLLFKKSIKIRFKHNLY